MLAVDNELCPDATGVEPEEVEPIVSKPEVGPGVEDTEL